MGQRGTMTCDVILENVRVPAANIIGGVPGQGFKTAMKVLDRGRLNISAVACGIAQRVLDESARYARDRKQFGKPLGEFQLIQAMLADSQAELLAGWALVRDVAERFDRKPAWLHQVIRPLRFQGPCAGHHQRAAGQFVLHQQGGHEGHAQPAHGGGGLHGKQLVPRPGHGAGGVHALRVEPLAPGFRAGGLLQQGHLGQGAGSTSWPLGSKRGLHTGSTSSSIRRVAWVPAHCCSCCGVPAQMAASMPVSVNRNGRVRVSKCTSSSGRSAASPGRRGMSQRVAKVGTAASVRLSPCPRRPISSSASRSIASRRGPTWRA
jgi:hypothetical protein